MFDGSGTSPAAFSRADAQVALPERCGTEASSRVIATRCRETSERRSPPAMIDKTYGHLLPDALERGRSALDALVGTLTAADGAAESTG